MLSVPLRLSERGLSTAGRKADLEQRLQGAGQTLESGEASRPSECAPQSEHKHGQAAGKQDSLRAKKAPGGVFKAGKRKNFVRINLKVVSLLPRHA